MGDNPALRQYAAPMERGQPFIRLTLDVDQPIELSEFVGAFTAVGAEYDRYIRSIAPGLISEAALFVREVRQGSTIAELVPLGVAVASAIGVLSGANTVHEFVERYGKRLGSYLKPGGRAKDVSKSELKDFSEQVAAIANNPGSTLEVAALEIENGETRVRAAFKFDTRDAREIQQRVAEHKRELDHNERADRERVLMVFTRSDIGTTPLGKRSGEQVRIEAISNKSRPLIYASEMAEQQIKFEINEADDNVYKKGFVVDVNIESRNGKPVAYSVTNLHQIIDLDEDE